jgi:hypothetical protein
VVETLAWAAGPEDVGAVAQWLDRDMAVRLAIALAERFEGCEGGAGGGWAGGEVGWGGVWGGEAGGEV